VNRSAPRRKSSATVCHASFWEKSNLSGALLHLHALLIFLFDRFLDGSDDSRGSYATYCRPGLCPF